ncbi:hypothetical protein HHK36_013060 [Tetracentron sinense]|uniref:Uncharacterized protein n=1 Tax=Tetracentron sinense TaxID=13715 RepID=A0A835DF27_TETSI|nr:hypothetical protein HHK36_013060 [Tetracentron sinense]
MSGRSRAIKLFCPSLSKLVSLVAMEEQNLDLGSIARAFGLDPVTLRLNGYFISRGVDLISSSVTWKSLLSFFSARGLSTGTNDAYALILDGKLCKAGTKRAYNPSDGENGNYQTAELNGRDFKRKPQLEDANLLKKKKINESNSARTPNIQFESSGYDDGTPRTAEYNGLGFKRKPLLGDANPLNKKKMKGTNSGEQLTRVEHIVATEPVITQVPNSSNKVYDIPATFSKQDETPLFSPFEIPVQNCKELAKSHLLSRIDNRLKDLETDFSSIINKEVPDTPQVEDRSSACPLELASKTICPLELQDSDSENEVDKIEQIFHPLEPSNRNFKMQQQIKKESDMCRKELGSFCSQFGYSSKLPVPPFVRKKKAIVQKKKNPYSCAVLRNSSATDLDEDLCNLHPPLASAILSILLSYAALNGLI